jgi:hypothetical protein
MDEYFKVLGLQPGATRAEIKKAFKSKEKALHSNRFSNEPDVRAKANEEYKKIKEAFEQLAAPVTAAANPQHHPKQDATGAGQGRDAADAPGKSAVSRETVKCAGCGSENKDNAKVCRKCGRDMAVPPAWHPDAAWHLKTLGVIYAVLTVLYFGVTSVLSKLPKPYQLRDIPIEMTPWLVPGGKVHLSEDQLKPPPEPPAPPAPSSK